MDKIKILSWLITLTVSAFIKLASVLSMILVIIIIGKFFQLFIEKFSGGFCIKCNRYCRHINFGLIMLIEKYILDVDAPQDICCSCKHDY